MTARSGSRGPELAGRAEHSEKMYNTEIPVRRERKVHNDENLKRVRTAESQRLPEYCNRKASRQHSARVDSGVDVECCKVVSFGGAT